MQSKKIGILFICLVASFFVNAQVNNLCLNFKENNNQNVVFDKYNIKAKSIDLWFNIDKWNSESSICSWVLNNNVNVNIHLGKKGDIYLSSSTNNQNVSYKLDSIDFRVNTWYHLYLEFNQKDNLPLVLINKHKVDLLNINSTVKHKKGFSLGGDNFIGRIDELKIWNKKFIAEDIVCDNTIDDTNQLYSSLLAYYNMDSRADVLIDNINGANVKLKSNYKSKYTDNPLFQYRIISGYLRATYFKLNEISDSYIRKNNDIIYFGVSPMANGQTHWDYADNNAEFANVKYLDCINGRNGVLKFSGIKSFAKINNSYDLLMLNSDKMSDTFTFETDLFLSKWKKGAQLIEIIDMNNDIYKLCFGSKRKREIHVYYKNRLTSVFNVNLETKKWNHISLYFNIKHKYQHSLKINNTVYKPTYDVLMPDFFNNIKEVFIAKGVFGYIDQVKIWSSKNTNKKNDVNNARYEISEWNDSKLKMYWPIENVLEAGIDIMSWKTDIQRLRKILSETKSSMLRIGVVSGSWKKMIVNKQASKTFINNLNKIIKSDNIEGLDVDFEWAYNDEEWFQYNNFLKLLGTNILKDKCFTVTIHPYFYNIDQEVIDRADFISIQSYGPSPARFPVDEFKRNINTILKHGIPPNKIVMGIPFYGTTEDGSKHTTSYRHILMYNKGLDTKIDNANYMFGKYGIKKMRFNGQSTVETKCKIIKHNSFRGIMYWDMFTDVDINNAKCLLRGVLKEISSNNK